MTTPTPTVTGIDANSGSMAGGETVTVSGTGLSGALVVQFGGTSMNVISATDTAIQTTTPASSSAGSVDIAVNFPTGLFAPDPAVTFTFVAAVTPAITGMSIAQGPQAGGTPVTISGTDLTGATSVLFGTIGVTPNATADTITVTTPSMAAGGPVTVQVSFPTGPITAGTFNFIPAVITGPVSGSGSVAGGTQVTITGTGLEEAGVVLFGTVGSPPTSVTDTEIVVNTPPQTAAGSVNVQVNFASGDIAAGSFDYIIPPPVNALFVVRNQTTVPDDLVFVKFLGAQIGVTTVAQTYGAGTVLKDGTATNGTSYSLADMTAQIPGAPAGDTAPIFALNNYSGGRIYFSLGVKLESTTLPAAQNSTDGDFNTVYGYVEPSVFPNTIAGNTNADASYVDFIGIPVDLALRNCADGTIVNPPANNPLTTPGGTTMFDALTSDTNIPAGTVVDAITSAVSSVTNQTVTISGIARILSPSIYVPSEIPGALPYHDWTSAGSLIAALTTSGAAMPVASYVTTDTGADVPLGTLFGFSGSKTSTIGTDWAVEQSYSTSAVAVLDLNPNGTNTRIPQLEGVAGIKMSGSGGTVGDFDIYLQSSDLDAPSGIYGANPPYVVDWTGQPGGAQAYSIPQIVNDLSGRVVGDLLAGFNFGWAACATTVAGQAAINGLAANLTGTVFDVNSGTLGQTEISQLTTGQLFYLLSLQPSTADLWQWFGVNIQPNQPTYYNNYSSDFQALTQCYNMAFTDRLQGPSDPDMFFMPSPNTYFEITLLPGAYSVAITG